ncbi:MAG: hypothetical protein ACOH1T_12465 [Microbacteriaceae bacterium]
MRATFDPAFVLHLAEKRAAQLTVVVPEALATLSDVQRSAITPPYVGYTQRPTAARLPVPLGTIETRVRDGMAQLTLTV